MVRLGAALLVCLALAAPAHAADGDVLPDLAQRAPNGLEIQRAGKQFRLGFNSTATNVGAGPLTLHGYRRSRKQETMRVDQLVQRREGPSRLVRDVGLMSYAIHPDHQHWHFLGFERYQLRSADGLGLVGRDHKTGFCLGDRVRAPDARSIPNFSPVPLQGDTCGLGRPGLLGLFAGISPGWADKYAAQIEGQYIDVTDVPSGTYVLTHWVNSAGRIQETEYTNNGSSTRFSLRWRGGVNALPKLRVLRRCPGSLVCPGRT